MSTRTVLGASLLGVVIILNLALGWRHARRGPWLAREAADPDLRCTLIVDRSAGYSRDRRRLYLVRVDRRRAGKVQAGGQLLLEVARGTHLIQVSIDGFRSRRIQVPCAPDAQVVVTCRPRDPSPYVVDDLVLGLIGMRPWIVLEVGTRPQG